ncbi:putative colanic acid biosynthesis acetyltransferase [Nitrospira sp. NS4]|uniref:putative colanic acid biosynthesis acetyltransferase n=1 Tax=Nitrospira sp. NS4 TaxID=3414498 RepID=UPI003C2D0D84
MQRELPVQSFPSPHSYQNRIGRVLWTAVWLVFFRPSPRPFHAWRRWLLRLFGARIERGAHPYPSARIWAPWNLSMEEGSCLGDHVDCYAVDRITLEPYATVSQYAFLCTAGHDYTVKAMPVITAPIRIGRRAWVAADAFVGPGVMIGEGAVVGARASVFRHVDPWTVVGGNPARIIKKYAPPKESA